MATTPNNSSAMKDYVDGKIELSAQKTENDIKLIHQKMDHNNKTILQQMKTDMELLRKDFETLRTKKNGNGHASKFNFWEHLLQAKIIWPISMLVLGTILILVVNGYVFQSGDIQVTQRTTEQLNALQETVQENQDFNVRVVEILTCLKNPDAQGCDNFNR